MVIRKTKDEQRKDGEGKRVGGKEGRKKKEMRTVGKKEGRNEIRKVGGKDGKINIMRSEKEREKNAGR